MMNDGISLPKHHLAYLTTMYFFPLLCNPPEIVRAKRRGIEKQEREFEETFENP